ncbi:hypothetical protein MMC21_003982 [Puttea exsequens]|nr:hypothetical protein [Puttea exsequens]
MLQGFKQKLTAPAAKDPRSTTPAGTPPKDFIPLNGSSGNTGAGAPDTSSILKALANMAKTNTAATGTPSQTNTSNVPNLQNPYLQNIPASVNSASPVPPAQAVNVPGMGNGANPFASIMSSVPGFGQNMAQSVPGGQPNVQANPVIPQAQGIQQQVQLLQMLQAQGVPQDQWAPLLAVLMQAGGAGAGGVANAAAQPAGFNGAGVYGSDSSRDRNGHIDHDPYSMRSPSGRYRERRSRSRSPAGYGRRRDSPPSRRRDSPVYGDYGRDGRRRQDGGRGGSSYRQRSPDERYRRQDSPRQEQALPPPGPKNIEYDHSLHPGHIKVLSRTLFVGGVTCTEDTLRGIFSQFGIVQTCIVNVDKRHAFVKMITRKDAIVARDGMERYKSAEMQLRTRWGVGFGPRDCSDYQTGISIIPLERLTDADRKWMLTAEYGGTGGKTLEQGMVVEEPDIEIGAGVSSKAISRRMQTDKSGHQGPRSSRDGQPIANSQQPQRYRQNDNDNRDTNTVGVPPAVPGFGYNFPANMPPGFPPGFQFPPGMFMQGGSAPAQPPPPGAS